MGVELLEETVEDHEAGEDGGEEGMALGKDLVLEELILGALLVMEVAFLKGEPVGRYHTFIHD